MENLDENIVNRFEKLIDIGKREVIPKLEVLKYSERLDGTETAFIYSWTTQTAHFIKNVCSENSLYYTRLDLNPENFKYITKDEAGLLGTYLGCLEGAFNDYKDGFLVNIRNLLRAEIFTDFLDMGEYLLNEGYQDAAAVIIGSVLEDSLRKLAIENSIEILNSRGKFKTIEPLNQDLRKYEVYDEFTRKQITSWGDLRNNAAHGHYDKYDEEEVKIMLLFVQKFCSEYMS